jgi:RNA polymerase sigma-70 factor (ECF subfamily)
MAEDFEDLIHVHLGRIRHIARRYAASGSAEDLAQEILIRLWKSYPRFRGEAKVETWIYRVALNTAMTYLKGTIRNRRLHTAIVAKSIPTDASPVGAETDDLVVKFSSSLGDIDASVLMMYLDGLSADAISEVLGISANAINVRINRMKQKFIETYVE